MSKENVRKFQRQSSRVWLKMIHHKFLKSPKYTFEILFKKLWKKQPNWIILWKMLTIKSQNVVDKEIPRFYAVLTNEK